jgi:hypothetical protein
VKVTEGKNLRVRDEIAESPTIGDLRRPHRSTRTIAVFSLTWAAAFAFIAAWTFATPLFAGPDEPTHAIRAIAVSGGQFTGSKAANGHVIDSVPKRFAELTRPVTCDKHRRPFSGDCQRKQGPSGVGAAWVTNNASTYPPLYYALVGWPLHLSAGVPGMYGSRLASGLLGSLFIAIAVSSAARTFGPFGVAAVTCAAMPSVLYLSGVINPNGLEATSALAVWTAALGLVRSKEPSRADMHLLGAGASVMVLVRPLSPLWLLLILGIAASCATAERLKRLAGRKAIQGWGGVLAACTAAAFAWTGWAHSVPSHFVSLSSSATTTSHWPGWEPYFVRARLMEMIGSFGWNDIHSPAFVYAAWLLLWTSAFAVLLVTRSWLGTCLFGVLSVGVFAGPASLDALATPGYQFLWQGRYSLPIVVGLPILAIAMCSKDRLNLPFRIAAALPPTLIGVVLFAESVALFSTLRTYLDNTGKYLVVTHPVPVPSPLIVGTITVLGLSLIASATVAALERDISREQGGQSFGRPRPRAFSSDEGSTTSSTT